MTESDLKARIQDNLPSGPKKFGIIAMTILLSAISGAVSTIAAECVHDLHEKRCQRPGLKDQARLRILGWRALNRAYKNTPNSDRCECSFFALESELNHALLATGQGVCQADIDAFKASLAS